MNPAQKALWFIESHLADELTLDDISDVAGVTRFHMVRAFAAATGFSVMRYVRARRLSEAARSLASGAPDILQVALDAEYGSHEAFTRAFRDHFGLTPETVRSLACIEDLKLQEPIQMNSSIIENLDPPRFEVARPLLVAGIGDRHTHENGAGIPSQWQRFHQSVDDIPHRPAKSPMAFAATATMPAISTTLRALRSPISPICRVRSLVSGFPSSVMRCSPTATTSRPSDTPSIRSGTIGCLHPA